MVMFNFKFYSKFYVKILSYGLNGEVHGRKSNGEYDPAL